MIFFKNRVVLLEVTRQKDNVNIYCHTIIEAIVLVNVSRYIIMTSTTRCEEWLARIPGKTIYYVKYVKSNILGPIVTD